jgi:hypothetical protein
MKVTEYRNCTCFIPEVWSRLRFIGINITCRGLDPALALSDVALFGLINIYRNIRAKACLCLIRQTSEAEREK